MNTLERAECGLIEALDHNRQVILHTPERQVVENIPIIWAMLGQVTEDWKAACQRYPSYADVQDEHVRATLQFEAFLRSKPRLFQCLFSYVIFFFMLENGYYFVYSELNRLNRQLGLRIPHDKPPKRTEFLRALWQLRCYIVAHWAETEKQVAESIAGRQWGYAFGHTKAHNQWPGDMEHIVPGFPGIAVASIPETHARCSQYLGEFDRVCADYLKALIAQMPQTQGGIEYHGWWRTEAGSATTRR